MSLNVTIHPSAYYYRNYMIAFLLRHIKGVQIHEWETIDPSTYIHCIMAHNTTKDELGQHLRPHTKIVFVSGEPFPLNLMNCHLAIHCLHQIPKCQEDKFVYVPFYALSFAERLAHPSKLLLPFNYNAQDIFNIKEKFCAYLYSNPVAYRDAFFDAVAKYKSPDALGSCRSRTNKTPQETTRFLYDMSVKHTMKMPLINMSPISL